MVIKLSNSAFMYVDAGRNLLFTALIFLANISYTFKPQCDPFFNQGLLHKTLKLDCWTSLSSLNKFICLSGYCHAVLDILLSECLIYLFSSTNVLSAVIVFMLFCDCYFIMKQHNQPEFFNCMSVSQLSAFTISGLYEQWMKHWSKIVFWENK